MTTEKKILFATDFSEQARAAARVAARIAAKTGSHLVLTHIHPFSTSAAGSNEPAAIALQARLMADAIELKELGAEVEVEFLGGATEEGLLEVSHRHQVGLIVLASKHKRGFIARHLFGSVAEFLAERADAPTMVVRDAETLSDWLLGKRDLGIFTAVDLGSSSDSQQIWTKWFSSLGTARLAAGYVNWIPDEALRLGLKTPRTFFEEAPEVRAVLERDLKARVEKIFGDTPVSTVVEPRWGRADVPLIDIASREHADLIVVGTRQRLGLGRIWDESVSRGTLHEAPMNVVIVPLAGPAPAEFPLPSYRSVLAPTDFSEGANHAVAHAYSLVEPGGTVILLHVPDSQVSNQVEIVEDLGALVPARAESRGIVTRVSIGGDGDAGEEILHTAARLGVDAICMGTHGRSWLAGIRLGSVAQTVVESSRCPVLLVRHDQP